MKVLHVLTSCSGGAANAAITLHKGLLEAGVDSHIITLYKNELRIENLHFFFDTISILNRIKYSLYYRFRGKKHKKRAYKVPFSHPYSLYDLRTSQLFKHCDIVNLHWIAGFLDLGSFFNQPQKPIVWTMHDEYPYLGGHHYEYYKKFDSSTEHFEDKYLDLKIKIFSRVPSITFVSPSRWLYNNARKSIALQKHKHLVIPYGVDHAFYYPREHHPTKKLRILVLASDLTDSRKGFDDTLWIMSNLHEDNFEFHIVGNVNSDIKSFRNVFVFGKIDDRNTLAEKYSNSDYYLLTSKSDNLPNSVLESLSCGTPVISYPIGGIPDMIVDGENGFLFNSKEDLLYGLSKLTKFSKQKRNAVAKKTRENFSNRKQINAYLRLYNSLIS